MIKTGPKNSILDIRGLSIGQAHDVNVKTGVTVILPDAPAACSVAVSGGGPGTREISALQDGGLIEQVHAIVLSGGSVYGLAAADGVCAWLGAQGRGYSASPNSAVPVSPIVPSAILFDNANGGDKSWGLEPPFRALALDACNAMCGHLSEGAYGAGFGATAGLYPGGIGSASEVLGHGTDKEVTIGALIAANPVGSPYMPGTDCPWAWAYEVEDEFGGRRPPQNYRLSPALDSKLAVLKSLKNQAGQSTVIGTIAVSAKLTQKQLKRVAIMAQDGLAMSVQPSHTPLDGDTIFTLSIGETPCDTPVDLAEIGAAAARCVARALTRAVIMAKND
jgi:D-aminopeptidase